MSAVPPFPVQATGGTAASTTTSTAAGGASTRSSLPRAAAQQANLAANGSGAKKAVVKEEPQHIFEEEVAEGVTSNWEVAVSRRPRSRGSLSMGHLQLLGHGSVGGRSELYWSVGSNSP
jgi:hypothetical protein